LKNITEQISVIEQTRLIGADTLRSYLPDYQGVKLPAIIQKDESRSFSSEREILYKILFDMKNDMNDLKKLVFELMEKDHGDIEMSDSKEQLIQKLYKSVETPTKEAPSHFEVTSPEDNTIQDTEEIVEESLSLVDKEIELIKKALEKHHGKRKHAAKELGISERTLYRKIKEYNID